MSLGRSGARLMARLWQQGAASSSASASSSSSIAAAAAAAGAAAQTQTQQHAAAHLRRALQAQQARGFAARGGGGSESVTYAGLTLTKASGFEYAASKALGGFMWFWVFYMLYHNWEHKMYGLPYIFEREGLDDDDDGHGHGHGHVHGKH